jgi:gluconokinase
MSSTGAAPGAIVIVGPAGAGKTTVGRALAAALGWRFHDADDFHSLANVERMRRGVALTDVERAPWLALLRALLTDALATHDPVVLACSALRESYRAALVPFDTPPAAVRFVYLRATPALLRERLSHRVGHYASVDLLASQLATLEEPHPHDALVVDASRDPDALVHMIRNAIDV